MIGILNYGLGNVSAFSNVFNKLNVASKLVDSCADLFDVDKIILPGVGSFDYAMQCFNDSGLREEVDRLVLMEKIPVLGVCVGLQMMAKSSEEGQLDGLNWLDATVQKFDIDPLKTGYPLPHMGWNELEVLREDPILEGLHNSRFYFLHSYFLQPKKYNEVIASSDYRGKFCSVIRHENIYGMQCHPEKSHAFGLKFLNNFAEI